jgi:PAS domain S-box-containing protein
MSNFLPPKTGLPAGWNQELRSSLEPDEPYRILFQQYPHPIWIYDEETLRFLVVNDAALREYGYAREEFLALTLRDIHPEGECAAVLEMLPALPESERSRACRTLTRDGAVLDVEVTTHRFRFGGRPCRLMVARDVTSRKRDEARISALNIAFESRVADLETLLNVLPIGVAIAEDRECSRIRVNPILAALLGLAPGANASLGAPPHEKPPYKVCREGRELTADEMPMQVSAARGIPLPDVEVDVVLQDGRKISFLTSTAPLFDEHGVPRGCISAFLDITERKAGEDALREANEKFEALIQASPLAIVSMDFDGNVKGWNRAAEEIFGWKQEEVVNRPFPIVPDEDMEFFRTNVYRARTGGTVSGIERRRRRKDGALVDVALWNAVQRDGSGNPVGVISVIADITERKRLEEQLQQSQKMEAVGRLAGGVAHDFNNLMTVVTGFSQVVLEQLTAGDPLRPHVEEILSAGRRAAALTSQLLAFGRRQMIHPRVLSLNRIISDMEQILRRAIMESIELEIRLDPALGKIRADRGQIEQVLMSLAVNARDSMPDGGVLTIRTANADIASADADSPCELGSGPWVLLEVRDTGEGMDEETRKRLFEPFFTTRDLGRGTGLGLSAVYGIVKQNGGDISVISAPERGTAFRIWLPRGESAPESADTGSSSNYRHGSETILLVEDEPGVRRLAGEVLRKQGYTVLEAADGRDALRLYVDYARSIDLLLTDVIMPQMSGRELSERLLRLQPDLKVIYMSGYAESVTAGHGISHTSGMLLQKPFTPEVLARKLREVLNS